MEDKRVHEPASAEEIIRERKKRILSPKTFVLFLFSAVLVVFLLRNLEIRKTLETFRGADMRLILLACGIYFMSNLFKSLRFAVMLRGAGIGQMKLYAITSYHNFFNQIFPARTGELTFVYYLKKMGGGNISKGLHILLVTRIFDFIVVAAFFVCSLVMYYGRKTSVSLAALGLVFLAASVVSLFYLKWLVIFADRLFRWLVAKLRLENRRVVRKIGEKIEPVVEEFSSFEAARFIPGLAVTSILVWGALYAFSYVTIHAFGVDVSFLQSVAGSTGGVLTNVLPINSFGSFGTMEAGWTGGFVLVGMSAQDAITTGFGNHIVNFVASAVIALGCFIVLRFRREGPRPRGDRRTA